MFYLHRYYINYTFLQVPLLRARPTPPGWAIVSKPREYPLLAVKQALPQKLNRLYVLEKGFFFIKQTQK